ncbi:hypothetical protein QP175_09550 [Sphingomonas aerolata]|uniref:hypothetical protein n=1 Tax=Sphingomonas aerolata TaxID=185951 RepID=UPI002FE0AE6B
MRALPGDRAGSALDCAAAATSGAGASAASIPPAITVHARIDIGLLLFRRRIMLAE